MRRKIRSYSAILAVMVLGIAGLYLIKAGATGLSGVQWTQIGPAPLQINAEQNFQGAGPDSGQVVDVAIDPRGTADKTIYIAAGSGGIWKSTDTGSTWSPMTDKLLSLSTGAVALDPGNPSIVYAGTNNPAFGGDCPGCTFNAVGIYKSTDGANTWTLLANSPKNRSIRRIVMPVAGTLLVGTTKGLWRSTDGGGTFEEFGDSNSIPFDVNVNDIRLDTQHPDTTARISFQQTGAYNAGIYMSGNVTDGIPTFLNMWTDTNGSPLQGSLPRAGGIGFIAFAQSNGDTIYTTIGNSNPGAGNSNFEGMWVGTNAHLFFNSAWTYQPGANTAGDASGNNGSGCQCGYDQTIGVDPTNDQTLYIGFQELWKSTNGGANFSNISNTKIHWDHHAFTFGPHDATGQTFYVGEDGGVATTTNGGGSFTNINGSTSFANGALATNLLRQIDIGRNSDANRKWTYGGFQDTGNAQFGDPGYTGNTWQLGQDGDGGPMTVDPCDNQHAISTDDGGYSQTTNGGGNWSGSVTVAPAVPGGDKLGGDSFAFDQTCDKTVYAGFNISDPTGMTATTYGIYQSTDNGNNYKQINSFTTNVQAIATAKIDPNVVWAGLSDGTLSYSTNALSATPTWNAVTIPGTIAGKPVLGVAIDPNNTDTVFVVYPGIAGTSPSKHIFMTSDHGAHWSDISGSGANGLPDLPLHSVTIDPNTASAPRTVIVGGDGGVFQTTDDGANWQVLGFGLPTVGVNTVALDSSTNPSLLRIGTYGRSTFELGAATGPLLAINTTQNFGNVCPGSSPTTLLQLFNVGASDLIISDIKLVSGSTDFVLSGPSFPKTIAAGEEVDWTIQLTVTPSSTNPETATFEIDSNDSVQAAQQVTYTATIGQPKIGTAIADSGSFGNVCAGNLEDLNLTVNNGGSCNLNVTGLTFVPSNGDFLAPTFTNPTVVAAGGSTQIPIRYSPKNNTSGTESTVINLTSNDSGSPAKIAISGNAPPGVIAVTGSGTFGNVCAATTAQQVITVSNVGPCNLNVGAVTITNNADGSGGACTDFTIENSPFPAPVSADANLPITIAFTPTSGGAKTCYLQIPSDDPNKPNVTIPLTATTPAVNIDVPPDAAPYGYNFPGTVIQSVGACNTKNPFPVSNNGLCPVNITSVAISGTNGADYAVSGLPSLTTPLGAGQILGQGNLATVFSPTTITRPEQATVTVTYESDPITHATTMVPRALCGEGTSRGLRVLVTAGGVPLPTGSVTKLQLSRLTSNRKSISVANILNPPLQSFNPNFSIYAAPCASFKFHYEWGGVTNPIQLTAGDYQLTASAIVGGKKVTKTVSFTLGTCSFNQNVVVAF
jgi:photosystem II stability/assembly factor-like uncharacterized protein